MMTLTPFTLTEIATAMTRGTLGAEEFVTDLLRRKENLVSINAFVSVDEERALRDARQADAERAAGRLRGRCTGCPLASRTTSTLPAMSQPAERQHFANSSL